VIGSPAAKRSCRRPVSRRSSSRPLDFLVVSDHSEALGAMVEVANGNPAVMNDRAASAGTT
jgi:hypothetical protein